MLTALGLVTITAVLAVVDPVAATPWRHVYLLPVVAAAIRRGVAAGVVAALGAILLFGPIVLTEIERAGPTRAVLEATVTFVMLLLAGTLTGALAAQARRQRRRYDALLAAQRAVAEPGPLETVLGR